ncbi:mitotic fidelity of chromosome transmission-related protein [Marasmius tenuissimus]|uniref:Mitotic fidelity of chromosome transmission-related protein n=1 Tax=Marasmius tenuissimus TaxID=585030 RepID=A0ABR3A3C7_9AGAR
MDRDDTATPRPPSPTGSTRSDSTISSYADATGDSTSDTIMPPSPVFDSPKPTTAFEPPTAMSNSESDAALHESKFTFVQAPDSSEHEGPSVPQVLLTSPGGGRAELDGGAAPEDGEGSVTPANTTAASSSAVTIKRTVDGLVPPPKTKRNRTSSRSKSAAQREESKSGDITPAFPEQGWDGDTPQVGKVLQYRTGEEVERTLTCTATYGNNALQPSQSEWSFRKDFGDERFIASGRLLLPPNVLKAYKATRDNTYIFYVVEGAVCARIHETQYVLCQGSSFMVPRGNRYSVQNISNRSAKLHFVQAREIQANEADDPLQLSSPTDPSTSPNSPRRSRPSFMTSKIVILITFILERLMKRFAKYRKVFQKLYVKYAMMVAKSVRAGPKAYLAFFFLGFLIRGIGFRKSFVPTIRVMVGGQLPTHHARPKEITG